MYPRDLNYWLSGFKTRRAFKSRRRFGIIASFPSSQPSLHCVRHRASDHCDSRMPVNPVLTLAQSCFLLHPRLLPFNRLLFGHTVNHAAPFQSSISISLHHLVLSTPTHPHPLPRSRHLTLHRNLCSTVMNKSMYTRLRRTTMTNYRTHSKQAHSMAR